MGIRRVLRLRAALKRTSALGILSALALPLPAAAQSIWGGSGSTSATTDYNTATNWSNPPGVAPISAGTSAVFANSGPGTVNVSAAVSPNSWTFATNAQSYTITGANVTFNTGTGLIDNANAGQSISIDNSLGGAGGIQLNGNSTLTLTTINTYTGATTINPGATLALSGLGGIPFSSVVTANGTFDISGSAIPFKAISTLAGSGFVQLGNNGLVITAGSTEFSGTIAGTGSGGIEIAGGTQTLSGVNTYAGVTQIDPGATLALKGNGSIANTLYVGFLGAGTLDISQTKSGASVSGLFDPVGFGKVSLGSKTLTFTGSAGFFNGVIQDGGIGGGTGGNVTIANGGLATFGGVNTYTGFTTINAGGELDMSGNGSIAASKAVINNGIFDISCLCSSSGSITSLSGASTGIVNLGANTLTITNGSGTYAGAILDGGLGGGFAITGGKEVLTGASSYTGATTITGATLEVDGSISGTSGVTVNSGGMLSGTGTIDPPTVTINSGATLAPGNTANPFGALTITGTLLFNAGSFYAINVAPGAGNNSKTAVVGSATLGGNGTVVVTPQLGHYSGAVYQILTTTTGLTGTFAGLTVNGNFVGSMKLDYATNPGDVDLNISGASLLTTPPGANQNQQNVIGGINNGILNSPANAPLPAQFLSLGNLSGPSLLNALTQLDGEAGDRRRTCRVPIDGPVPHAHARSVRRRPAGQVGLGWRRRHRLCPRATREFAARYRARLRCNPQKGAAADVRPALDRLGHSFRWQQQSQWRCGYRLDQRHRANLRLCGRDGLSRLAEHHRRLRARRRRHQLGARQRARHRKKRRGAGRRLRHHVSGAGLPRRRARLHQPLVHDQSRGAGRSAFSQLPRPELWGAAGRRLALRRAADARRHAVWGRAGAGLPYAVL